MPYIEELKFRVINRFDSVIETKSDAKKLSDFIFFNQKDYLSESTIRRFFNLTPSGKTSKTTLDIFSRFVGFDNYQQFCDYCEQLIENVTKNNADNAVLLAIQSKKSVSIFEVNLICSRIIQLLKENNFSSLLLYFNNKDFFNLIKSNTSINDLFAQTLGPYFSSDSYFVQIEKIMKSKYFIPLVLYNYVDIQNYGMHKYYAWIINNYSEKSDLAFAASVISLNHVMNNKFDEAKQFYDLIEIEEIGLSPTLNGRVALLKWIFNNNFNSLLEIAVKYSNEILYFSLDIVPFLIYSNNIELLKIWFSRFPHITNLNKSWVEKDILEMLKIAKFIAEGDLEKVIKMRENNAKSINSSTFFNTVYHIIDTEIISNHI
jgi:hypothetical protein